MTALNASARLVDRNGMAERVFWHFLGSLGAVLPSAGAYLVDREGRGTPIFLEVLGSLSPAPPSATAVLIDMRTGRPTAYFQKFLGGLS